MSARQVVLIGCNYAAADGSQVRREPGDVVDDMPEDVVAALGPAVVAEDELDARTPAETLAPGDDKPARKRASKAKE